MLLDCSAVTQILTLATHAISHVMPAKTTISGLEEVIENHFFIGLSTVAYQHLMLNLQSWRMIHCLQ